MKITILEAKEGGKEKPSEKYESEIEWKTNTKEEIKCETEETQHKAKQSSKKKTAKRKLVD